MIKFLSNIQVFCRLFIAFAIAAAIPAVIANAMNRRRKIVILLRNFIMSTSIHTQAILDYYLSLFLSQKLEIKQHLEEWSISTRYLCMLFQSTTLITFMAWQMPL